MYFLLFLIFFFNCSVNPLLKNNYIIQNKDKFCIHVDQRHHIDYYLKTFIYDLVGKSNQEISHRCDFFILASIISITYPSFGLNGMPLNNMANISISYNVYNIKEHDKKDKFINLLLNKRSTIEVPQFINSKFKGIGSQRKYFYDTKIFETSRVNERFSLLLKEIEVMKIQPLTTSGIQYVATFDSNINVLSSDYFSEKQANIDIIRKLANNLFADITVKIREYLDNLKE